jgi:biopolymer transport protein ExbB
MFVILATAVAMLAITVERFLVIARASAINASKLVADVCQRVERGDVRSAIDLVKDPVTPAQKVARALLEAGTREESKLMNAAEGAATLSLPPLSRRLPHLNTLANTATLLGLLGTIFGLVTAFSAVGAADASQRSAFLAAGISQALATTAFGLIVAVPALVVHGFLVGKLERVVEQVDEVSIKLIQSLVKSAPSARAQQPAAAPQPPQPRQVSQGPRPPQRGAA